MALTFITYLTSGATSDFVFTFPYISTSHIRVSVDGVDLDVADFTVVTSPSTKVTTDDPVADDIYVKVYRETPGRTDAEPLLLIDFQDGSVLSESDLDKNSTQLLYLAQEAGESTFLAIDYDDQYTAVGKRIKNLGAPIVGLDATTKQYVDGVVLYGPTTIPQNWTFSGDAVETDFALTDPASTEVDMYVVDIDGVMQKPTTDFTIAGTTITFVAAPASGTNNVTVRNFGVARDILGDNPSITGDLTVGDDLVVTDDASIGGDLTVTGAINVTSTGSTTARSLATRFSEVVNVKDYGAVGDGSTNDTVAIQAALDAITSVGGVVIFPTAAYKLSSALVLPQKDNLTLDLQGSELIIDGGYAPIQYVNTIPAGTSITSNDIVRGNNYIEFDSSANAATFAVGDLIQLKTTTLWYQDNRTDTYKGELHLVERVSGTKVYIQGAIYDVYAVATETISVAKLNKIKNLTIKNGVITNNRSTADSGGLNLYSLVDATLENLVIDGHSLLGVQLKQCYGGTITNCTINNSNSESTGYGIQLVGCTNTQVTHNSFSKCRRGVDVSGVYPSHNCGVSHNRVDGSGLGTLGNELFSLSGASGFGSHSQAVGTIYDNNTVIGCKNGFNVRGFDEVVQNNVMRGKGDYLVVSIYGSNLTVINNSYFSNELEDAPTGSNDDANRLISFVYKYLRNNMGLSTITNNIADKLEQSFIRVYNSETSGDNFDGFDVSNNTIRFIGGSAYENSSNQVYFLETTDTAILLEFRKSKFLNNIVGRVSASSNYLFKNTGITINIDQGTPNACLVEAFPLSSTVVADSGTVSVATNDLYADILPGRTHIYGNLKFTTASTATVYISLLPHFTYGQEIKIYCPSATEELWANYNGLESTKDKLYLSNSVTASSSALTNGTHEIHIDVTSKNSLISNY